MSVHFTSHILDILNGDNISRLFLLFRVHSFVKYLSNTILIYEALQTIFLDSSTSDKELQKKS